MTRRDATIAVVSAGALLVLTLVVQHFRDAGRDRELEQLRGIVGRDKIQREAATAKTDTAVEHADTAVHRTARADSGWDTARRSAAGVPAILAKPVHDTVKIRELVTQIDTLIVAGEALKRAAAADTVAIAELRVSFAGERKAWSTERDDLKHSLDVSESRHRHWGLGCTGGAGVVRSTSGVLYAGPAVTCGVAYRW